MSAFAAQRVNMVDTQVRPNDVTDFRIHQAMLDIPRETFVPPQLSAVAYMEGCIDLGDGRALLDARCFAKLVQLEEIKSDDVVLDVGCGSGYSSAVLARLALKVVALEENTRLLRLAGNALRDYANVNLVQGTLAEGYARQSPYNVIFVGGAVEAQPTALLNQLATGGRLVCVQRAAGRSHAYLYVKGETGLSDRAAFDAQVPTLPGFKAVSGFVF